MNYAVSGDSVLNLNKDIREARTCFENAAYKATMVLCGSVLEHALLDRLSVDEPAAKNEYRTIFRKRARSIDHWKLDEMLRVSRDLGLITAEIYQLCDMLRDYRNLIHPAVSRRACMTPDRTRGQRSLEATKQALNHFESEFASTWQDVHIINIRNVPCHFVTSKAAIQAAITNTGQLHGLTVNLISSYAAMVALLHTPLRNAIIVNTHGEIMPVPRGRNWRNFYTDIGMTVRTNACIFVNIGGYPFYYERDVQPRHQIGQDGLNTFLSVGNMSADCMNPANTTFTSEGTKVINLAHMTQLPHNLVVNRCARWQGVSQKIVFLKNDNLCAISAVRVGRGWFVHLGLDSSLGFPNQTPQQLVIGDTILGNLATAIALYVADRLS
jgi:hypothetical protein